MRVDFIVLQSLTLFSVLSFSREVCAVNIISLAFFLTGTQVELIWVWCNTLGNDLRQLSLDETLVLDVHAFHSGNVNELLDCHLELNHIITLGALRRTCTCNVCRDLYMNRLDCL